jgi:hypothetical protein
MTLSPVETNAHPRPIADDRTQPDAASNSLTTFKFRDGLPTAAELPDSDDEPVDSERQKLIPDGRLLTPSERAVALQERLLALGVNPAELQ